MRHQPLVVGRVTVESTTELIVQPAARHGVERAHHHVERLRVTRDAVRLQEHAQPAVRREFRRPSEPAVLGVKLGLPAGRRPLEHRRSGVGARRRRRGMLQVVQHRADPARRGQHVAPVVRPGVRDGRQELAQGVGRIVAATVERHALGRQQDAHRPAAPTGHRDHRRHVQIVEVRALFAIDLDRHETLVQDARHLRIGKRLPLHDVTPVAGRVSDRQEDRPVLFLRLLERFVAPGVPVDRVVEMLQEIRARLAGQMIRLPPGAGPAGRGLRRAHGRPRQERDEPRQDSHRPIRNHDGSILA